MVIATAARIAFGRYTLFHSSRFGPFEGGPEVDISGYRILGKRTCEHLTRSTLRSAQRSFDKGQPLLGGLAETGLGGTVVRMNLIAVSPNQLLRARPSDTFGFYSLSRC
jgi:hypothetical protein